MNANPIEQNLDEVLRFLKKDYYSHHIDSMELQSNIDRSVLNPYGLFPLIERLDTDGFIERRYSSSDQSSYGILKITLIGIQFVEAGGYCQQLISVAKKERRNKLIYIWSVIAGVASTISVLIAILK